MSVSDFLRLQDPMWWPVLVMAFVGGFAVLCGALGAWAVQSARGERN